MSYDAELTRWHDFYITVGAASATLAGLLFVGLSLHLAVVASSPDVRQLARATLTNFLTVLLIALFMLIPTGQPWQTAGELIVSALGAMVFVTRAVTDASKEGRVRHMRSSLLIARFGLSIAGFVGQVVVGALLLAGQTAAAFGGLVAVVLILLMIAVRNAWDLLVTVDLSSRSAASVSAGDRRSGAA